MRSPSPNFRSARTPAPTSTRLCISCAGAPVSTPCPSPISAARPLCATRWPPRNSELWAGDVREFKTDYVAVTPDGAQWLVDHGIKVIGVDYLSVAIYADPITPHNILLKAGIIPLEGLNLSNIAEGNYTLYCLPLKLMGADGAPARTILVEAD